MYPKKGNKKRTKWLPTVKPFHKPKAILNLKKKLRQLRKLNNLWKIYFSDWNEVCNRNMIFKDSESTSINTSQKLYQNIAKKRNPEKENPLRCYL